MHFKSLRHVRDHVKVQGRAYDLLTHIALHTNMHTGEAFELSVERQAHRHAITPEWTRILLNGLIATGELVVERSRGRHPNRYRFPLEQCQACQEANPEVELESTPNSITLPSQAAKRKALWSALIERDGEHCVVPHCSGLDLTIDHKVPTRKGGTDDLDNLQLMCRYHNGLKGDRLMSEFNKLLEGLNPELQFGVRGGEDSLNPKRHPPQPHTQPQTLPPPTPNSAAPQPVGKVLRFPGVQPQTPAPKEHVKDHKEKNVHVEIDHTNPKRPNVLTPREEDLVDELVRRFRDEKSRAAYRRIVRALGEEVAFGLMHYTWEVRDRIAVSLGAYFVGMSKAVAKEQGIDLGFGR